MKRGFAPVRYKRVSDFLGWQLAIAVTHFQSHSGVTESMLDVAGLALLTIIPTTE